MINLVHLAWKICNHVMMMMGVFPCIHALIMSENSDEQMAFDKGRLYVIYKNEN